MFSAVLRVAAVLTIGVLPAAASAGGYHELCRKMGVGCGDGYHSRSACPPKKSLWAPPWPIGSPACPACGPAAWPAESFSPEWHVPPPGDNPPARAAAGSTAARSLFPHWDKKPSRR